MNGEFRESSEAERKLLARLLEVNFPGKIAVESQIEQVRVRTIDENGSLELSPQAGIRAEVARRVPVEGEFPDADGVTIHVLLHVVKGFVAELEVYKEDGSQVIKMPPADALQLMVLD